MPLVEITEIPPLSSGEESLVDLHSLLNTLNVLFGELQVIGLLATGDTKLCAEGLRISQSLMAALTDREVALREASRVAEHERNVLAEASEVVSRHATAETAAQLHESIANVRSVFAIMRVRADETLARAAAPMKWERYSHAMLLKDLHGFLGAVERNAKGRFRILFNAARQGPADYYVDLKVETERPCEFRMPPVFSDVLRDLVANARKYTKPGGNIIAAIYQDATALHLAVSDTGRGIPEAELSSVVHFGKRASNVTDVRTMGGGFGLTKAFLATKRFNGRFWLQSELGAGTKVRIAIPSTSVRRRRTR